jgi:hypothetical protein
LRPEVDSDLPDTSAILRDLALLLSLKNGFYAFESALHVRPIGGPGGILQWNMEAWRENYGNEVTGLVFFAEDIFGMQFALDREHVTSFDPETGDLIYFAGSLEEWARRLLQDPDLHTAYPLAHEWQLRNGPLPARMRLAPRIPFVLGGSFDVDNLHAINESKGMHLRSELALQIRNLPEGAQVSYEIAD